MASINGKKICPTCKKNAGIATCDGCQQCFCSKHFIEHRQELSQQVDNVCQIHDVLIQDLDQTIPKHSLFEQIDKWEQESIGKIQTAAEIARTDLHAFIRSNQQHLKEGVMKITKELQTSREADDYTEIDIEKWTQQIHELRKMSEFSPKISIHEDEMHESCIHLITIRTQPYQASINQTTDLYIKERFDVTNANTTLFEEGRVVTCNEFSLLDNLDVYGMNQYSTGTHHVQLRIEKVGHSYMFIGISSNASKSKYQYDNVYGWWDLIEEILCNLDTLKERQRIIKSGDNVTLTLDCDQRKVQLRHHPTNRSVQLKVHLDNCPFPWKILVKLQEKGDSIRII